MPFSPVSPRWTLSAPARTLPPSGNWRTGTPTSSRSKPSAITRGVSSWPAPRHSSDFQNPHRNTRAIVLDLKNPEGLAAFLQLAAKADATVENFRPDVKTKLGIDYDSLRQINPHLAYGSISGFFGQDGPYHKRPASIRSHKAWADWYKSPARPAKTRCASAFDCRPYGRPLLCRGYPRRAAGARHQR